MDGADSPEGYGRLPAAGCVRFAQGATAPPALRVVVSPMDTPFGREGSKGSEGVVSPLRAMNIIIPLRGMENHTTAPAARWKCTPIPLRGLPPEGEVLAAHYLELLMSSTAEQRVKFPLRGNAIKPRPFLIQGANCASNMAIE